MAVHEKKKEGKKKMIKINLSGHHNDALNALGFKAPKRVLHVDLSSNNLVEEVR